MSKIYAGIRGTCDFDPFQAHSLNKINNQARKTFEVFGYEEIVLPILEEEGLFRRGVGETTDIVERQMFKIEGKDVVLRPEGTAQVIRYYLQNALYKQSGFHKFFYLGAMFRGERPQKGRLRQFHHVGAESIGSDSYYVDAEIISLSVKILEAAGVVEKELRINTLGCAEDKDKFSRYLRENLESKKSKFCHECQKRLEKNPLRILDCKNKNCAAAFSSLNLEQKHLCEKCKEHFDCLRRILDDLNLRYTYDPYLVRGLDYYTNTVFEIVSGGLGTQNALGAGGRYNNLVKCLGGPDIPAIGFALGVERLMLVLNEFPKTEKIKVFIAVSNEGIKDEAFRILQKLRDSDVSCDLDYSGRSLKGQLKYAQKKGVKFVVLIGDEELKEEAVILKNMDESIQEKVKIKELISKLK